MESAPENDNGKPEIKIILENNIFFPGEIIKGKINLKSGNFLEKGIIKYEIYGIEKIHVSKKYNIECNNSTKIYQASLEYPGLIDYSLSNGINIPFEINLPPYILPSFEFSQKLNNKNNYGYIKYFLQIEILELNLIKQKFIIIRRQITKLNTPLIFQAERNEKLFGIFNKGCPILTASYNKNYYCFKENTTIKININNNNSKFNIKNIVIKLIRNIVFKIKDNNENEKSEDIIFTDELYNKIININEKINEKKENINIEEIINIEEPEKIFNRHNVDYFNLGLRDKSNLILFLPSFDSSLFKCEYLIKIEGKYDTIMPISNLNIDMPVSVYHNKKERIKENNEFNLLNSINDIIHLNYEENNNVIGELIPKPGNNEEVLAIQNKNSNNIINDESKKEIKTYRNDEEKEWNNITNGQIIPEKILVDNEKDKKE